ncbi:MAG: glycine cleavage system protein H [Candidatus Bathyarchaeia archaeon]
MVKVKDFEVPENLYYSLDHTWVKIENKRTVKVGVTEFFLKYYRSISSIELKEIGEEVQQNISMGKVETLKGSVDLYAPISGTIKTVNQEVRSKPTLLYEDPYVRGWLLTVEPSDLDEEQRKLLTAKGYADHIKKIIEVMGL